MARWAYLLLAGALVAVAVLMALEPGTPAGEGSFPVAIEAGGASLFNGTVHAERATAYSVLRLAAAQADLEVEATGQGATLFVTRIGAWANAGDGGWCFAVWDDGWVYPQHSAGVAGLRDGQAVRWVHMPSAQRCM